MAFPNLVVSFGEMVDFLPEVAGVSLAESSSFVKDAGGAPANVAIAVSKLGGSSAFIGKFGDDEFGHMLMGVLKQHRVNVDGCLFDTRVCTGLAFLTSSLAAGAPREFMFYRNPSADMLLTAAHLDLGLIRRARAFHYGSVSLAAEPCRSACLTAVHAGALCSYDPNVRSTLWPSEDAARSAILGIWKEADFIKVSDEEVAFLTKGDPYDEENVLSLWFEGLKLLVVTDGKKGCRYFTECFKGSVSGFKVNTVDTTGAGDAFVGCLLYNVAKDDSIYLNEEKLREVLRFCNACGAICTQPTNSSDSKVSVSSIIKSLLLAPKDFNFEKVE